MFNITNHQEMPIRTPGSYQLTPVRVAIIKKQKTTNVGEEMEKLESLYTVSGDMRWCSHSGKQYRGSSKNRMSPRSSNATAGYLSKKN